MATVRSGRPRGDRARLQDAIDDLGLVHAYRPVPDRHHELTGWWATPDNPATGCDCTLCAAARASEDVHLGSVFRTAVHKAVALAANHQEDSLP